MGRGRGYKVSKQCYTMMAITVKLRAPIAIVFSKTFPSSNAIIKFLLIINYSGMSEDEDLYCNPQTNVFLQARLQAKPPKKVQEKKSLFKRKPPPSPERKITPPRAVVPASANAELGSLFKSGVTKPSDLRKNTAPEKSVETLVKQNEDHVIDFRAHLRAVPSPIKTEAENRRCSVTSETDLPPPPPENDDGDKDPPVKSPPVPKRTSTLRRPVPTPPSQNPESEQGPLKPFLQQDKQESDSNHLPHLQEILPGPPPIEDLVVANTTPPRPKRRILQKPSKAPQIPLHSFPDGISSGAITQPTVEDNYPDDDCDEMYTENDLPPPEENCDELYTENDLPPPEDDSEELYTENDIPFPEEDCDEMYTENDLPPPDLPTLPPLYDAPKTPLLPDRAVCIEENIIEDDDEVYTDEVCDYPMFKPANPTSVTATSTPAVVVDDGGDEEIYEDPLIGETESCPVEEYRPELEECEDIYDDIGSFNVSSVEPPVLAKPQPSPMAERHNFAPPSTLPPPPQLPTSAPPPASTKQKQKGGLFGGFFKKGKKKSVVETQVSQEQSIEEDSAECSVALPPQREPEVDDDELYNDGEIFEYSDDDDEPIYEDQ